MVSRCKVPLVPSLSNFGGKKRAFLKKNWWEKIAHFDANVQNGCSKLTFLEKNTVRLNDCFLGETSSAKNLQKNLRGVEVCRIPNKITDHVWTFWRKKKVSSPNVKLRKIWNIENFASESKRSLWCKDTKILRYQSLKQV